MFEITENIMKRPVEQILENRDKNEISAWLNVNLFRAVGILYTI